MPFLGRLIDMPSGLFSDQFTNESAAVILASYTLSFQSPKMAFFIPENQEFLGEWKVLDIGLDSGFLSAEETTLHFVDAVDEYRSMFERNKFDHKGHYGHAIIMAGSYGKIGAAVLASKACLLFVSCVLFEVFSGCNLNCTNLLGNTNGFCV